MESAARRALGASQVEARRGVVIETVESPTPSIDAPRYTRRSYKAPPGKRLYEATSTAGFISVRASAVEMKYATNVIDLAGATERQRGGQIRSFFATEAEARQQAAELREEGYLVSVVEARPYAGQAGE